MIWPFRTRAQHVHFNDERNILALKATQPRDGGPTCIGVSAQPYDQWLYIHAVRNIGKFQLVLSLKISQYFTSLSLIYDVPPQASCLLASDRDRSIHTLSDRSLTNKQLSSYCPGVQPVLPISHQPKQNQAEGGIAQIKTNPTQISEWMSNLVHSQKFGCIVQNETNVMRFTLFKLCITFSQLVVRIKAKTYVWFFADI